MAQLRRDRPLPQLDSHHPRPPNLKKRPLTRNKPSVLDSVSSFLTGGGSGAAAVTGGNGGAGGGGGGGGGAFGGLGGVLGGLTGGNLEMPYAK